MKVAFAGDWHQNTNYALNVIEDCAAHDVERIYQLGDFLGFGEDAELFVRDVDDVAAYFGIPVYFIDGNHEDFNLLGALETNAEGVQPMASHVIHLPRGYRWELEGVRFCALGGATSLDKHYRSPGHSWFPEEAITAEQAEKVIADGQTDVLLLHDCPSGVDIPGLNDSWWRPDALQRAKEHRDLVRTVVDAVMPSAILHGHFHTRYSRVLYLTHDGFARTCWVTGLGMDGGPFLENVMMLDLSDPSVQSALRG